MAYIYSLDLGMSTSSTWSCVKPNELYMMLPKVVKALRTCQLDIQAHSRSRFLTYPLGTEDKKALIMQNQSCGSKKAS
jgi:hypothetical protein